MIQLTACSLHLPEYSISIFNIPLHIQRQISTGSFRGRASALHLQDERRFFTKREVVCYLDAPSSTSPLSFAVHTPISFTYRLFARLGDAPPAFFRPAPSTRPHVAPCSCPGGPSGGQRPGRNRRGGPEGHRYELIHPNGLFVTNTDRCRRPLATSLVHGGEHLLPLNAHKLRGNCLILSASLREDLRPSRLRLSLQPVYFHSQHLDLRD